MYGIEQEIKGLQKTLDTLIEKKNYLSQALAKASDESKKFTLQHEIQDAKSSIQDYRKEILELTSQISSPKESPNQNTLEQLLKTTNQLAKEVEDLGEKLDKGFDQVLHHLSEQDQKLLDILAISQEKKEELAEIFQAVDENQISENTLSASIAQINSLIADHLAELPDHLQKTWKELQAKPADKADIKGQFKLKIPIIPGIIEFEKGVGWNLRDLAKKVWDDMKKGNVFFEKKA